FCPGQKNFRQGFAKLKYRWLQSSRLKMSRYSLFCVYKESGHNNAFSGSWRYSIYDGGNIYVLF
ncbi:hypothetical protein DWX73_10035, partial [Coprococcus sp. AF21-14LB]